MNDYTRMLREIERQRWLDTFNKVTQLYTDIIVIAMAEQEKKSRSVALVRWQDSPVYWKNFFHFARMEHRFLVGLEKNRVEWSEIQDPTCWSIQPENNHG